MSDSDLAKLERLKKTVLSEYPRLRREDTFNFKCAPALSCFNTCCGDVTIVLTPYDIIRMKNQLGISSEEFLRRYTLVPFNREQKLPLVILKMNEDERKTCPFVGPEGCTVYENRPWACRMYPIGLASPKRGPEAGGDEEFFFLLKESPCDGHDQDRTWTIDEWIENQGVTIYNRMGDLWQEIVHHDWLLAGNEFDPAKMEMFYLASFNLDKFRRFILDSTFLAKFEVEPELLEKIKTDDVELMKFAFRWLKFGLFGEQTMTVKPAVVEEFEQGTREEGGK